MSETRKIAAILVADVVGYSRLAGADEDRTLSRLRGLRSDLIDPAVAAHRGRIVNRAGDGSLIEFRSVVDAVRCAIEVQNGLIERNAGLPPEHRIEFRIGIHLGDVVEENDGDLMGDGVNIAARLEGIAEPGGICLSNAAYEQVRDKVKETFVDLGEKELKNIARPLRVYSLAVGKPAARAPPKVRLAAIAAFVALIAVAAAGWYFAVGSKPSAPQLATGSAPTTQPAKPSAPEARKPMGDQYSIVVLPFTNLSGDPAQDYFADGITESLTTDLSQISGSYAPYSVIARNTAFTYEGRNVDVREIGKQLGVRYALEGSVQRDLGRVWVNVQLIDAECGNHVWTERFDKPSADPFELQDEIVGQVSGQLKQELLKAEIHRSQKKSNPDAMDLVRQASDALSKGWTLENLTKARDLCRRAVALDPPQ